jgi:hypothetical protein
MKHILPILLFAICGIASSQVSDNSKPDKVNILPIRGFCIAAPQSKDLDEFIKFIDEELAPRSVNTLILRVDFNYQYESHPELRDSSALSKKEVKKLVAVCKRNNIQIVHQVNLLGHQSWNSTTGNLLKIYPQFDETPLVKIPKDVVICDWHYDRPYQTPVYFAMKGLSVITCPWSDAGNAVLQAQDMVRFRNSSPRIMKDRYLGMVHTVWSDAGQFLDNYYGRKPENSEGSPVNCFKALFTEIQRIAESK